MYEIFFTKKVEKELNRLSTKDTKIILQKIRKLDYPLPINLDIKPIVGVPSFYRLRQGKLRAIFEIDRNKKEIWIRKIGYRGSVYRP